MAFAISNRVTKEAQKFRTLLGECEGYKIYTMWHSDCFDLRFQFWTECPDGKTTYMEVHQVKRVEDLEPVWVRDALLKGDLKPFIEETRALKLLGRTDDETQTEYRDRLRALADGEKGLE